MSTVTGARPELSVPARALSGCRFLVSPLLEVLAAAEVLRERCAAPQGGRRRVPGSASAQRHALSLPPAEVRQRLRCVAGQVLRHRRDQGDQGEPGEAAHRHQLDFTAFGPLQEAVRDFFQDCLAGDWPRIRNTLASDVALRAHDLAAFGVRHVVDRLPGLTVRDTWDETGTGERDLVLVPSVFRKTGVLLANETGTLITYPASGHRALGDESEAAAPGRLGALLGRGRAAALLNIGDGCGTGDLADRLGVSAGTASVHVAALRNGGLVATHRVGKAVRHVLTPIGSALIMAQASADGSVQRGWRGSQGDL